MSDTYGPALPPGLTIPTEDVSDASVIGPALPSRLMPSKDSKVISHDNDCHSSQNKAIGPTLPPGFSLSKGDNIGPASSSDIDDSTGGYIGPAMPPGFGACMGGNIGPTMPPGFEVSKEESEGPILPPGFGDSKRENIGHVGPAMPPGYAAPMADNSFDDDVIGPLPSTMEQGESGHSAAREFDRRAEQMKYKLTHQDEAAAPQRESWMTELPEEMGKNFGLTSRSFRQKPATSDSGDRSVWTDTPSDKKEKELSDGRGTKRSRKDKHDHHRSKRDKELAKEVEKYNKTNRSESLLEMHTKERKKKKKKDKDEPQTRRPFDRDADLQVNRFDDAKRRSLIKKSQELDTRFSHGKSKFI